MQECQHAVLFYEQSVTLWQQCVSLIRECDQQERCWRYIADEHRCEDVRRGLSDHAVTLAADQVLDSATLGFRESPIRLAPIVAALHAEIQHTLQSGMDSVLLLIEMAWTIRTPSGAVYLPEYEAALHDLQQQLPVSFVCLYNQNVLLDSQLLSGLHTHACIHTQAGPQSNPFFVPPAIYARRDPRAQFHFWLGTLDPTVVASPGERSMPGATYSASPGQKEPIYHLETLDPLMLERSDLGRWKIRCLGQLRVYREDGTLVEWRVEQGATRKTKTLFAYLLYRGARGARAEELATLLWPDASDTQQSLNRLYHVVNSLRRALSPDLAANRQSPFVLYHDQYYFLAVPPNTWIDLPMFQELCYRGANLLKQDALEEALLCYQSAERLYTGDFLADIPVQYTDSIEEDWCLGRRYWLRDMYLKMLYSIAAVYRRLQQFPDALRYCDRALRVDPCCEAAHQEKLLTLYGARRRDALERQYRLYCQALTRLGLGAPSAEIQALYLHLRDELLRI